MYIKEEGIFDHPPLINKPIPNTSIGNSGETGNKINWSLLIIVALGGILVGYGIKFYLDSKEREKRYSNIDVTKRDITSVDKD